MERITIHLKEAVGPSKADYYSVSGTLKHHDELGVRVHVQEWGQSGKDYFFPTHLINRVDYDGEVYR